MTAMDWSRLLSLSLECGPEVRRLVGRAFADSCAIDRAPPGYVTLTEAARIAGVSKGSMCHAAKRGAVRSQRLMPPAGRSSIVLVLHRGDVEAYKPRAYPRKKVRRGR
jgi:hypothetical protein